MSLGKLANPQNVRSVLGVDASTNSFAFCVFEDKQPKRWGEINFTGSNVYERLADAQRRVGAMKPHVKADLICFEGAVYVQNKSTVILLAMALGAMIPAIADPGTRVETISPVTWQYAIGNKPLSAAEKKQVAETHPGHSQSWYQNASRNMRKERTMEWVKNKYGIVVESDNVSDAIGLASVAYDKYATVVD